MSCLTEWVHGRIDVLACASQWTDDEKTNIGIVGPYFTATILIITLWVTLRMTYHLKRVDTFIQFTNTFNAFMEARQQLDPAAHPEVQPGVHGDLALRTKEFYARYIAFQFSEYYAYRSGNLDRRLFTLWVRSRWSEFRRQPQERLNTVSYTDAWDYWLTNYHRNARDGFTRLMGDVHGCEKEWQVWEAVRKHGPLSQKLYWIIRWPVARLVDAYSWVNDWLSTFWQTPRGQRIWGVLSSRYAIVVYIIVTLIFLAVFAIRLLGFW
jgi:hypothetical protein